MINLTCFSEKNIAVLGLGYSGIATVKALTRCGAKVVAWDDLEISRCNAERYGLFIQDFKEIDWSVIDFLVVAPGIPLTHPKPHRSVEIAKKNSIPIIGDLELFAKERDFFLKKNDFKTEDCPVICVTGTNGKSTTCALIYHILKNLNYDVQLGGNFGIPVLNLATFKKKRIFLIETSSYQIDLSPSLKPTIGIFLNLTPDHLDRHGTLENYASIKMRLIKKSLNSIINLDDKIGQKLKEKLSLSKERIEGFSIFKKVNATYFVENGNIFYKNKKNEQKIVSVKRLTTLRGAHNLQNLLAACSVCSFITKHTLDPQKLSKILKKFQGLPHRMEEVLNTKEILVINDSKATNAEATAQAFSAFERVYWIVGGIPKEDGIKSLKKFFPKIVKAYLIGQSSESFSKLLKGIVPYHKCFNLEVAVQHAVSDIKLSKNDNQSILLFSPACSSFDQFKNYEERGDFFRQLVCQFKN